jgi:hypothetical protein
MKTGVLVATCVALVAGNPARAEDGVGGVTAVSSKVSNGYVRKKLPDGSFQPEFYAFGKGGNWGGQISDVTIDKLTFLDVAHVIAEPLAGRKYFPARDPGSTRLLIMVYWGTTAVPESAQNSMAYDAARYAQASLGSVGMDTSSKGFHSLSSGSSHSGNGADNAKLSAWSAAMTMLNIVNQLRTTTDFANAQMLGYDSPGLIGTDYGNNVKGTALATNRDDLFAEIEENRYFVVLMAYDFQLLLKEKKHKLLWETRFSISERRNQFDKALPIMAQSASPYFGAPSNGLIRNRLQEGSVEVGTPKMIDFVAEPKK